MKKAVKYDVKDLQRDLKAVGVSSSGLKKRWKKTAAAVSNSLPWETISKTLPVRCGHGTRLYRSEQTPAGQMRLHDPKQAAGNQDPFPVSYLGSGRSSADQTEKVHAVNLYETKLVNSEGKELFSGVRSGLLLPYKAKTAKEQEEGLENRARELLSAAFTHKFAHLSEEEQNRILAGGVMPMDFVTTSLLSPDELRSRSGIHDDELTFQQKQNQILQQLCAEQPLVLEMKDSQGNPLLVKTQVRLASMNIPVNALGLNNMASTLGQTWKSSDSYNDSGLEVLLGYPHPDADMGGMVQEWLETSKASEHDKAIVRQLADQCRILYSQQKHHGEGYDAYKFVERLQLLSFKIGAECHFGCKSGKDRTGEADARIKVLAAEIDRLGYVPDPLAPPDREHREAVQTFLYGAGEVEIQLQNVNLPGYKTSYGEEEQGEVLYRILH
nr:inositol phosphate phosphatase SopB [Sansalvadorimonas sp. 2012CJ34-2]